MTYQTPEIHEIELILRIRGSFQRLNQRGSPSDWNSTGYDK